MDEVSREDLRAFREALGLSQVGLAERLGVSRRNVEDWEAKKATPPVYLRLALAALAEGLEPWRAKASDATPER